MDNTALYRLSYGLYVLTARDGERDNGCIVNTVAQVGSGPKPLATVAVSKQNLTHDMIARTGQFNASVLTTDAPFSLYQHFGMQSGHTVDKFLAYPTAIRAKNGILTLPEFVNATFSFQVTNTLDCDTHTLFLAEIAEATVLSKADSVTYAYYQAHVKPKPAPAKKTGWRCTICGYVYEGDPLPPDFICPLCKHGASDFVKIEA